ESITARFVNPPPLELNAAPRHDAIGELKFTGINARTIVEQDVSFPLGQLTTVTGVSGAGKSTLVTHVVGSVVQQSVTTTVTAEATYSAPATDRVDFRYVTEMEH